jgi:Fe-S-cluster containining protein
MAEVVISGYAIDDKLLARRGIRRCQLAVCQAACCSDGVWVDHAQAQRILAHAALIQPFLPAERREPATWFAELHDDPTFPSGRCIGTTTVADPTHPNGSTCVFLRPEDCRCAIQIACLAHHRPVWELKPYYCCLFPLVDEWDAEGEARRLTLDDTNDLFQRGGGCYEPCDDAQPVFQVYAEEVALALGVEGYRQLCQYAGVPPRL